LDVPDATKIIVTPSVSAGTHTLACCWWHGQQGRETTGFVIGMQRWMAIETGKTGAVQGWNMHYYWKR
jgi:hypothetical protein